jgi:hypothetical protein
LVIIGTVKTRSVPPQRLPPFVPQTRTCRECGKVGPLSEFPGKKNWQKKCCLGCRSAVKKERTEQRLSRKKSRASRSGSASKSSYLAYLASAAWRAKKQEYWSSGRPYECYVCKRNDGPFDMHHRTYERLGNESLEDLVPVCPKPCHARITSLYNQEKKKPRKQRRTLWQITEEVRLEAEVMV